MLEMIHEANDVKKLREEDLPRLADEIRQFLIRSVSKTGGHLASNLGTVELTIALHRVYTLPRDKIIWDVGHQSYTHKILTGRKDEFARLRQKDGISGFPRRSESPCDSFDTGHSSTSISAGLGYVYARELLHQNYSVVSVIGDGSITGGMAFEALNNAGRLKTNFVIVLNDNTMSISKNVGGMSDYLGRIRTSAAYTDMKMNVSTTLEKIPFVGDKMVGALRRAKSGLKEIMIPGMLFENMGLTYLGPVDGHNIPQLIRVLQEARSFKGPVLLHVLTEKGRGFTPAVRHPARFHGTGPFDPETGIPLTEQAPTYTDVFATIMTKIGGRNPNVVAVTAAMAGGTGLKRFANMYPDRFFDVGIAEGHAVTFAAGLSLGGMIPVVAVYSSFLQRAFDQIMEDVCMQNLHVIFALDRSGFVGADGRTHNGCFDLSYLTMMPNMTVMAPKNFWELSDMVKFAVDYDGPIAIRYPKGEAYGGLTYQRSPIVYGKAEIIEQQEGIAILAIGSMVRTGLDVLRKLNQGGRKATLVNMRFAKPIDTEMLDHLAETHTTMITIEENVRTGGFGEQVQDYVEQSHPEIRVKIFAIPDEFIGHGSVAWQRHEAGLDADAICDAVTGADRSGRTE
ncbi:MAG: 1-deoxy-D-xylulose-5-phosphate synthase [Lachnospiraceae bacterium]|jgi:1-deoxy-D-xylulose-5-phosphate synthase|nr:1-deoxy-D-xylulose-5-phosphate synthase [Lachnospiraceae bacterium]MCI1327401.1 1-deoxy-D-xylulose-5-phosphate synthase [Lachnospiraceae bacterium]